jgi:hypothetical protein
MSIFTDEQICGLAKKCPLEQEVGECPFKKFRQMPLQKAIDYINKLPEAELHGLMDHHRRCIARKEMDNMKK